MRAITGELTRDHADSYARMFQALQEHAPGGFLVHCTAGKDRTGVGVALILLALGVPRDVVMHDYLLTNEVLDFETFLLPRLRASLGHDNIDVEGAKVLSGVRPQYLDAALDEMERACGSQDAYLEQAIGLKTAHREELREHFGGLRDRGVERIYAWFSDFATPETLAAFGREVIDPLR